MKQEDKEREFIAFSLWVHGRPTSVRSARSLKESMHLCIPWDESEEGDAMHSDRATREKMRSVHRR